MQTCAARHAIAVAKAKSSRALPEALPACLPPPHALPARGGWWTPMHLLQVLILMAWGKASDGLLERFEAARALWADPEGGTTYQGFIKAWRKQGLGLIDAAAAYLRARLGASAGAAARLGGWIVLAVDGSRFELPRTAAHARVFGTSGQRGSGPQVWVTTLFHLGLGLPWAWRIGRADSSERTHLGHLLPQAPAGCLLVMDAGFVGYGLFQAIRASGRHFLVRVGRQVELLQRLGYAEEGPGGIVYLWPARAQRDRTPPLVLRLIRRRRGADRRRKLYLLTDVTDPARLSDELAGELYRLRWGVELLYRAVKQTLAARKLRSQAPVPALLELHGLLLGLLLLGGWSRSALLAAGQAPRRWSVAASLKVVRRGLRQPGQARRWAGALAQAVPDRYPRRRKTRVACPRKKAADPPPRAPRLRRARQDEIQAAAALAPTPAA